MKKIVVATFLFCLTCNFLAAQGRAVAFEMNARLGKGINMGNAFEAPTETAWGNPWHPRYFKIISELGFSHVRIPVRWTTPERSMDVPPYTIYPDFLNRIKQVVDTALKYGLLPIINMHHHTELFANPSEEKARFLAQWEQIACFFKDYPDSLLFEILNEPHNNLTPALWNVYLADALSIIRQTNPTRIVLIGTADWGGLRGLNDLVLPDDPYIILTLHYYEPFQFTHQGADWVGAQSEAWLGTKWNDTQAERQTIINEFGFTKQFAQTHNVPVHIGEFGAYSTADFASRVRWTNFLARWFEEQGFSWAYWEFSAGFGIYNPETDQLRQPLFDALMHNPMSAPTAIISTPIFEHNFEHGSSGWVLITNSGAQATMNTTANHLGVDIHNGGSQGWHVQLARGGIPLQQGKTYQVVFRASANNNSRSIVPYIGKSIDPWTSYSGFPQFYIATDIKEYSFTFTMNNPDNQNARLVFDLGLSNTGFSLWSVSVKELNFVKANEEISNKNVRISPNPAADVLNIINAYNYHTITIYNLNGRKKSRQYIPHQNFSINVQGLPSGLYILRFENDYRSSVLKFIKH